MWVKFSQRFPSLAIFDFDHRFLQLTHKFINWIYIWPQFLCPWLIWSLKMPVLTNFRAWPRHHNSELPGRSIWLPVLSDAPSSIHLPPGWFKTANLWSENNLFPFHTNCKTIHFYWETICKVVFTKPNRACFHLAFEAMPSHLCVLIFV